MGLFDRIFGSSAPSSIEQMMSVEKLNEVLGDSSKQPVVLYKHSNTCPSSFFSKREIEAVSDAFDGPIYEIVVQMARDVSNEIAGRFNIRHETPQVIIVVNGEATYHQSHGGIRREGILKELKPSVSRPD